MGIVAVLGGVGGGVLFVPIIGGFFPFHLKAEVKNLSVIENIVSQSENNSS